jgi:hypothetical protein
MLWLTEDQPCRERQEDAEGVAENPQETVSVIPRVQRGANRSTNRPWQARLSCAPVARTEDDDFLRAARRLGCPDERAHDASICSGQFG